MWRARGGATSGRPVMAVVAGVAPVFSLSNFTPRELAPRLAPCSGLGVAQPRCCRSVMAVVAGVPPVLSLSNFTPLELAPPARCGATSGRHVMTVVAGVPPVFSLSNLTPLKLAPRLAPCGGLAVAQPRAGTSWPELPALPQFFLSPTSLPFSLPPAWPHVAGSTWRNLGPARHGRCC